jgi:magnesium-transporting ATPase (P-type)
VVLLESGARVPADVRLFTTTALRVDESLLTGESLPVTKSADPLANAEAPLADRRNLAYMASVVASGRGRGYVVATGSRTAVGSIAESIRGEVETDTPLQQRMTRLAHFIGIAVGVAALLSFGIGLALGQPASQMFTVAVALAVAAVPEGLPVVFTITLALGVRRMAKRQAIIRRLPAVETLGSTTVIGSDKTGTLTENRMTVQEVWAGGTRDTFEGEGGLDVPLLDEPVTPIERTLLAGVLTNEAKLYVRDGEFETQGDPTEAALLVSARRRGIDPKAVRDAHPVVADLPFESDRQFSASLRRHGDEPSCSSRGHPSACSGCRRARSPTKVSRSSIPRPCGRRA